MPELAFEDFTSGRVFDLGTVTADRDEMVEFARRYDPQPFHVDEEAGRNSMFGALVASGWQTCGLAMRLTVDNLLRHTDSKGSPGLESLKWLKPVYPGDVLSLRHTIVESRPLRKRPDTGMVRARWELFNQHGDKVMEMEGYGFFGRREPATPEELARIDAQRAGG